MTEWSEILEKHGRIVWKTVYRLVSNDADAADCFQDTFVSALEFSLNHKVSNWPGLLKRLATARSLDHLRRRNRKSFAKIFVDNTALEQIVSTEPLDVVQSDEFLQKLRRAIAALPSLQAEACCLRFLEGLTYDEIAEGLNVSVNYVGVLLSRGKSSLREQLADFAPDGFSRNVAGGEA